LTHCVREQAKKPDRCWTLQKYKFGISIIYYFSYLQTIYAKSFLMDYENNLQAIFAEENSSSILGFCGTEFNYRVYSFKVL